MLLVDSVLQGFKTQRPPPSPPISPLPSPPKLPPVGSTPFHCSVISAPTHSTQINGVPLTE